MHNESVFSGVTAMRIKAIILSVVIAIDIGSAGCHSAFSIFNRSDQILIGQNANEKNLEFCDDVFDALKGTDACFVVTSWEDYFKISQDDFKKFMKDTVVIDCRRIYNPNNMNKIKYIGVGLKDDFEK